MVILAGLGNPGSQYQLTRHNIGFMVCDYIANKGTAPYSNKWKAHTAKGNLGGNPILLVKPQTYMNLSGESVVPALQFFKLDASKDLLVVQDDIDLPFGALRFQQDRSHGGHNGIRNIHQLLGNSNYARLKMGVGRPSKGAGKGAGETSRERIPVDKYVLQNFSKEELDLLPEYLDHALNAVTFFLKEGQAKAANKFNRKKSIFDIETGETP